MKKQVAPPTYDVNNIQQLPDIVKNQATMLKVKFDKGDADTRAYIINTLLATLNSNDGSFTIGHDSPNINADNVGDGFEELYQLIRTISQGAIPNGTISKEKLTALLIAEIEGKANTADVNDALSLKANTTDVNDALALKANLTGGNAFTGNQTVSDGQTGIRRTTGGTANKRWYAWDAFADNSLYLNALSDLPAVVRSIVQFFHDGGAKIFGSVRIPNGAGYQTETTGGDVRALAAMGSDNKVYLGDGSHETVIRGVSLTLPAPTVTTITSGFASGWSGTIEVRKVGNIAEFYGNLTKTSDVTALEVIYTLPSGIRPYKTNYQLINMYTSGGSSINGALYSFLIEPTGAVVIIPNSGAVTTNSRRIIDQGRTYITA